VRLLCELIRKREQRKRDLVTATMNIKYLELNPFAYFLRMVMELLVEQDTQDIFGEPVDPAEVPDYLGEFQFRILPVWWYRYLGSGAFQSENIEIFFSLFTNSGADPGS
jgi:hypothetical protein